MSEKYNWKIEIQSSDLQLQREIFLSWTDLYFLVFQNIRQIEPQVQDLLQSIRTSEDKQTDKSLTEYIFSD